MKYLEDSLYISNIKSLCVSDLHLGKRMRGDFDYPELVDTRVLEILDERVDQVDPERIIFNGDTFSQGCPNESIERMKNFQEESSCEVIFISGNHDRINFLKDTNLNNLSKEYECGNFLFTHGHRRTDNVKKNIIIGHVHPLFDGKRCFLRDKFNKGVITVIPHFNPFMSVSDVRKKKLSRVSPFLNDGVEYLIPGQKFFNKM